MKWVILVLLATLLFTACSNEKQAFEIEENITYEINATESWTAINDYIFVSSGTYLHVNMTLIISGKEATLVDAGLNLDEAQRVLDYIEENEIELKNIIITHNHQDHIGNLRFFSNDGVNTYNFSNTVDGQVIEMGKNKMVVLHTAGHFNDQHLSVEVNNDVLIAGDIIVSNLDPVMVLNYGGNRETLIKTLESLKRNNYKVIIPGHGPVVEGDSIIYDHLVSLKE